MNDPLSCKQDADGRWVSRSVNCGDIDAWAAALRVTGMRRYRLTGRFE
jgi:hypothetical protein